MLWSGCGPRLARRGGEGREEESVATAPPGVLSPAGRGSRTAPVGCRTRRRGWSGWRWSGQPAGGAGLGAGARAGAGAAPGRTCSPVSGSEHRYLEEGRQTAGRRPRASRTGRAALRRGHGRWPTWGTWPSFVTISPAAHALYEESLAVQRELGDRAGIACVLWGHRLCGAARGEYAKARALHEESLSHPAGAGRSAGGSRSP